MFLRILSDIADLLGSGQNNIDALLNNGQYRALVNKSRRTTAGWVDQSSSFAVPAGKKAIVVACLPGYEVQFDNGSRQLALRDTLGAADIVGPVQIRSFCFPFFSDADGAPLAPWAPAGAVLNLRSWNGNNSPRVIGGAVVFRIVDA